MENEKKSRIPRIKLTRNDYVAIVALLLFVIVLTIPTYLPKDNCEVARPEYKCATFEQVMIENCQYWSEYGCDTDSDISLVQVEWYIENLCDLQNRYHGTDLDCSNLKMACNIITKSDTCSLA
ncbi:MAG: hypothetical protein JW700_02585 [Candidatus Aenigmarchaeota archaeon]|nr:hypothetical protein [Candidatus Aenigmarchaeota archaeon]